MPPRRPKRPSRFDSIPAGASFEDDVQLDELRQPWSLRFGDFLRLVQERYGFTYQEHRIGDTEMAYLTSADGELRVQLPDADAVDQLDAAATEILCLQLGIPAEDFGLAG